MRKFTALILVILIVLISFCGCNEREEDTGKLKVVATVFPPYDFVRQIAGDNVELTMLLDPGTEVHTYDPSPKDIITVESCDVFIYIGGESDTWVDGILEDLDTEGVTVVCLMDCVERYEKEVLEGMESEEHSHEEHDEYDEHIWTSPVNAIKMVEEISGALCSVDPKNSENYEKATTQYIKQLENLNNQFKSICESSERNTLVFADRFPFRYMAEEYGLECFAAFPGCSEETEASAATVSFLIDKVIEEQIPAVFHTEFSNKQLAATVSEETGAEMLMLHSCHNITKDDFDSGVTYISLMEQNVQNLREALN